MLKITLTIGLILVSENLGFRDFLRLSLTLDKEYTFYSECILMNVWSDMGFFCVRSEAKTYDLGLRLVTSNQGCIIRLVTLDALQCTENVVF